MSLNHKMFSGHGWAFLSAFVLLTMVGPERAGAIPITYDFTGTVTETFNIPGVNEGDPFSGTLSYDTVLVPTSTPDSSNPLSITGYKAPEGSNLVSLQVKVGSQTFGIDNPGFAGVIVAHDYSDDFFFPTPSDFLQVSVGDATGRKSMDLNLYALPGEAFTSSDLPTSLDLSKFAEGNGISFMDNTQIDPQSLLGGFLDGSITSLTPVPEPSTLALFTLAIFGYGFRRLYGRKSHVGKPRN